MLLLSSQHRQQPQRRQTASYKTSSSPSFWIAQVVGAILICQPDRIERWLPMVAPFPKTIHQNKRRAAVNRILTDFWDSENEPNRNSGYDIQAIDELIVDNQRQIRTEKDTGKEKEEKFKPRIDFSPRDLLSTEIEELQDINTSTTRAKSVDSLFSNFFLCLHLLFSLPSIGEQEDDNRFDDALDKISSDSEETGIVAHDRKPSTYGEITPRGTRQLFGAMGLLDRTPEDLCAAHFVDLGSGTGKVVCQAVLELSSTIDKATGIELSPSRHQSALRAKQALTEWLHRPQQPKGRDGDSSTHFDSARKTFDVKEIDVKLDLIEGDLFDVDLSTATHIYVASLCFPDDLLLRLEERLRERIARQQRPQKQKQQNNQRLDGNEEDVTSDTEEDVAELRWVATLRQFPNDLGGIQPIIQFMEMSWTSPLGCAVYMYRCDARP